MVLDLERLGAVVDVADPCGADPANDHRFRELMHLAEFRRDYRLDADGREEVVVVAPPWDKVAALALELSSASRDLRLAVILARAAAVTEGVRGLSRGLRLVETLLAEFWDDVHPRLIGTPPFNADDLMPRVAALMNLAGTRGLAYQMERTVLVHAQGIGRFTLRDVRVARGEATAEAGSEPAQLGLIQAALESDETVPATRDALVAAKHDALRLHSLMRERLGTEAPDLGTLIDTLTDAVALLGGPNVTTEPAEETPATPPARTDGLMTSGRIGNRQDVVNAIDAVLTYYDRAEPASPVPLFLRRARRLVHKRFEDVIDDLVPDAATKIRELGGGVNETDS